MRIKSRETLRAMNHQQLLMYCDDCAKEIDTLRAGKAKLLKRVEELEATLLAVNLAAKGTPDKQR